jgi:hypothetical protein
MDVSSGLDPVHPGQYLVGVQSVGRPEQVCYKGVLSAKELAEQVRYSKRSLLLLTFATPAS